MKNILTFQEFVNESYINEASNLSKLSLYKLIDLAPDDKESAEELVNRINAKPKTATYDALISLWSQMSNTGIFSEIYGRLSDYDKLYFLCYMPEYISKFDLPNLGKIPANNLPEAAIISFLLLNSKDCSDSVKKKLCSTLITKQKVVISDWIENPTGNVNIVRPYNTSTLQNHPKFGPNYYDINITNNGSLFGGTAKNDLAQMAKSKLEEFGAI
jgi:hypothetical protein